MDQLSVPLQRFPQFEFQSAAFGDSGSDAMNTASSSLPLWNSDALSPLSMQSASGIQSANPSPLGSFGSMPGFGGIGSLVQQLVGLLQNLLQMLTGGNLSQTSSTNPGTANPEEYFNQAAGNSLGDPHLSFNGLDGNNHLESSRFDSMTDHPNLLDSNSFPGGYQLSTKVGAPLSNGATFNQSATIATNFGRTSVTMNGDGSVAISRCGQQVAIQNGQTVDLGHGENVTQNNDGSLTVVNTNSQGGRIATTLKPNSGGGVDVTADANGVNLGGDLVTEAENSPRPRFWFGPAIQ